MRWDDNGFVVCNLLTYNDIKEWRIKLGKTGCLLAWLTQDDIYNELWKHGTHGCYDFSDHSDSIHKKFIQKLII